MRMELGFRGWVGSGGSADLVGFRPVIWFGARNF